MQSLFEKIWASHVVAPETDDTPAVLYVDLHLLHEVTTPQAFDLLRAAGLPVRRTDRCLATLDHSTPTVPVKTLKDLEIVSEPSAAKQVRQMERNCKDFGIELRGFASRDRGIVHVMGPELGATQPGATIVCGDSHTSTHGAFGALAFGIGTTEVGHVLATQCLLQRKPKTLAINLDGELPTEVTAKDLILKIIGTIGVGGGTGHVIEYRGSAIGALSMEERMTVCNMSIEAGARAGMIAPDDTTYRVHGGPTARAAGRRLGRGREALAHAAERRRRQVRQRDQHRRLEARARWSRSARIPAWSCRSTAPCRPTAIRRFARRSRTCRSRPASRCSGMPVDVVFIGSCTNGRLSDIRAGRAHPARAARCGARALARRARLRRTSSAKPKPKASTRSCARPAASGASPAARCASA